MDEYTISKIKPYVERYYHANNPGVFYDVNGRQLTNNIHPKLAHLIRNENTSYIVPKGHCQYFNMLGNRTGTYCLKNTDNQYCEKHQK